MKGRCRFIAFVGVWLALPLLGMGANNEEIHRCVSAIDSIKSYDVTFRIGLLRYPDFNNLAKSENFPAVMEVRTNRDVFAVALGRRVEEEIGNDALHSLGVTRWGTARPGERSVPRVFCFTDSRRTYGHYVNPVTGDVLLADSVT